MVIRSSETPTHIRNTRRYILEDDKFHNYRCGNLKSYTEDFLVFPQSLQANVAVYWINHTSHISTVWAK
jgi:hypothetical protein